MELLTYQETVREAGIDPAAPVVLPELPEWIKHPPVERLAGWTEHLRGRLP